MKGTPSEKGCPSSDQNRTLSVVKRKIAAVFHCGDFHFGGPNRDRTDDLTDAKRHLNLFCIIFNYLWCFPLGFSSFPPLFRTLISMCYAAVCGASCGQKRSLPFAGNGFPAWTGSVFRVFACLHCNSEGRIRQVFSAPFTAQKLGGCKQNKPCVPNLPATPAPLTRPLHPRAKTI